MNSRASGTASILSGVVFHAAVALLGGFALGFALDLGVEALARGGSANLRSLAEFLPFIV
jgi:hypothetical protein